MSGFDGSSFSSSSSSSSASSSSSVKRPNILVTGTPGTGKSTLAEQAATRIGFTFVNVGDLVKKHECHEGIDEEFDSYVLDEDKLCDVMEPMLAQGGCVVDFHSPEVFPERWFDLVLVLRTETNVLYDRLVERGYSEKKRTENMECEIMQVVLEEARESYDVQMVTEIPSNTVEELESNVERIAAWFASWQSNNT